MRNLVRVIRRGIRLVSVVPIKLYQILISPLIPSRCNYYPTCSNYTVDAIMTHGIVRGLVMGLLRIGRCSARHWGGNDPVPEQFDLRELLGEYRRRSVKRR